MQSTEQQDIISQIPADLVQELLSREISNPSIAKRKNMSKRQLQGTIELCGNIEKFFKQVCIFESR